VQDLGKTNVKSSFDRPTLDIPKNASHPQRDADKPSKLAGVASLLDTFNQDLTTL
jgi:hypothetical protein